MFSLPYTILLYISNLHSTVVHVVYTFQPNTPGNVVTKTRAFWTVGFLAEHVEIWSIN